MSRVLISVFLSLFLLAPHVRANDWSSTGQTTTTNRTLAYNFDSLYDPVSAPESHLTSLAPEAAPDAALNGAGSAPATASCSSCYDPCYMPGNGGLLPDGNPCFGWRFPCRNYGDPWTLFNPSRKAWSIGGWVEAGVTLNSHGAFLNGPLAFPSTDELMLNQLWFFAERKADTGGYGWDWGARIDYVFGTDGPNTQAFGDGGWDFGWNSGGKNIPEHTYGSAIPQLYLELAYNDLTIKLGRFYTILGYEVVQAPNNFFYSHAYTMNYGEPFTHTGALVEWAYSDVTTLYGGYVAGWDTGWENPTDTHMFIGGIRLARWEDATLTYAMTAGDLGVGGNRGRGENYTQSIVLEYQLTDSWEYVFQSDFGASTNNTRQGDNVHYFGINQYLFYTINNCWSAGLRFEWFNIEDGYVITGEADDRGDYYALTAGLNYKPTPNLIIRPEIRADWYDATLPGVATPPFANNTDDDQLSAAIDLIFTF